MCLSYPEVYASYAKYAGMIGSRILTFEEWMSAREEPVTQSLQVEANKLLEAVENRM